VAALGFGDGSLADVMLGLLILAAGLESLAGVCIGCHLFRLLMRAGLIPEKVCEGVRGHLGAAPDGVCRLPARVASRSREGTAQLP
jgi:hypothetical protein